MLLVFFWVSAPRHCSGTQTKTSSWYTIAIKRSENQPAGLRREQIDVGIWYYTYEGHLESKERFAIKKYLLIIGKKKNMQVLSHTFTYFST